MNNRQQEIKKEVNSHSPMPDVLSNLIAEYATGFFEQILGSDEFAILNKKVNILENNNKTRNSFFSKKRNWYPIACGLTILNGIADYRFCTDAQDYKYMDFVQKCVDGYEAAHSKDIIRHHPSEHTTKILKILKSKVGIDVRNISDRLEEYLVSSNSSSKLYSIVFNQLDQLYQGYNITDATEKVKAEEMRPVNEAKLMRQMRFVKIPMLW